ncbi:hypothetical protein MASR1M45_30010 [Candidatus Kapaibacterium sp.]
MSGNLNANNANATEKITTISIYDNVGGVHELKITFTFDEGADPVDPTDDFYAIQAQVDGQDVDLNDTTPSVVSQITFNSDGTITAPYSLSLLQADLDTLIPGRFDGNISIQLADPNQITAGITNYAAPNSATLLSRTVTSRWSD